VAGDRESSEDDPSRSSTTPETVAADGV
jgi:hypothetical protein